MAEPRQGVARLNVERFERLLQNERDPIKRSALERLLAQARTESDLASAEALFAATKDTSPDLAEQARRLRLKAEECRTVADTFESESARDAFRRLAHDYDVLATRAESRLSQQQQGHRQAGQQGR
jgi:hypothetical protein